MPIQVECPSCHATIRVQDEHAGRRGRCPCREAVFVATATAADVAAPAGAAVGIRHRIA